MTSSMKSETLGMKLAHFHDVFKGPDMDMEELLSLRMDLIEEEYDEVVSAMEYLQQEHFAQFTYSGAETNENTTEREEAKEELLKELCDLVYVCVGTAEVLGMNFDVAFNRVHSNNMSKAGPDGKPEYREDGKLMKPDGYEPVELGDLI